MYHIYTQIMPLGIITAFAVIKIIISVVDNSKKGFIEFNLQLILNPYTPLKKLKFGFPDPRLIEDRWLSM